MTLQQLFLLAVLVSFPAAQAETIQGKVVEVDPGIPEDPTHLIYLDNGRVLRVEDSDRAGVFEGAMILNEPVTVTTDEDRGLDEIHSIERGAAELESTPEASPDFESFDSLKSPIEDPAMDPSTPDLDAVFAPDARLESEWTGASAYEPTVLESLEQAAVLHSQLTRSTVKDSICSNRAHVWSYRMWRDQNVKSMKAFLFYTKKYIRKYRNEWWYHVAPFVYVGEKEYVTDRSFFKQPKELGAWATHFVKGRFVCPYIEKYSEFRANDHKGWCYVRRVPMTVWMPWGVYDMDTQPAPTEFAMSQVRQAVNQALRASARKSFQY